MAGLLPGKFLEHINSSRQISPQTALHFYVREEKGVRIFARDDNFVDFVCLLTRLCVSCYFYAISENIPRPPTVLVSWV